MTVYSAPQKYLKKSDFLKIIFTKSRKLLSCINYRTKGALKRGGLGDANTNTDINQVSWLTFVCSSAPDQLQWPHCVWCHLTPPPGGPPSPLLGLALPQ